MQLSREERRAKLATLVEAEGFDSTNELLATLRSHPEAGRRYVPDHAALGNVRMFPIPGFADYLLFTRYDGDTIEVIRVLHGARDILAVLEGVT